MKRNSKRRKTKLTKREMIEVIKSKKYLTIVEAAMYTGRTVRFMYGLNTRREIPYYKPNGKEVYYDKKDLDNWMSKNKVASQEEMERNANLKELSLKKR